MDHFASFQKGMQKNEVTDRLALEYAIECWRLLDFPRPSELRALMSAGTARQIPPKPTRSR